MSSINNIFLKIVTFGPLIFIPAVVVSMYLFSMEIYSQSFYQNIEKIEKNLIENEKSSIKNKILNISDVVVYQKSLMIESLTRRVENRVDKAFNSANNIYKKYENQKTDEEIQDIIKTSLEALTWNDGESFIWIVDYNGVFQLAPKYLKHLENKSILNIQDVTGRYVIKDEISICKNKGEGFLWNTFTKPNGVPNKQYKQLAFVKALGHYNWYLGSSEYLEREMIATNNKLLKMIDKIDNIDNHYVLVLDTSGKILLNKSILEHIGKNFKDTNNKLIEEIADKIKDKVAKDGGGYLTYNWINIKTNKLEKKQAYVKKIPNSDWIVGSGFYMSDINNELEKQKSDMYDIYYLKSKNIGYLGICIIFLSFLVSYYLSRKLRNSFMRYETKIKQKACQLQVMNENLETKVKERTRELEKLKDNYEQLATTDALTNIHNRYSIMKVFTDEVNRANRYITPLSVILYDIDHFKEVNDTYGHKAGDDTLKELSNIIKASIRDIDIIGRYGGEEFLIILPNTKLHEAENFAHRLIEKVGGTTFDIVGSITISIGLVELQSGETMDEIFARVDSLLYKSKEDGRNRLSV